MVSLLKGLAFRVELEEYREASLYGFNSEWGLNGVGKLLNSFQASLWLLKFQGL